MAINFVVQASVVDIFYNKPKSYDNFLVDTNVWFWYAYTQATLSSQPYQLDNYPDYIDEAVTKKAMLYWCGLSLSELAHLIENTEFNVFNRQNNVKPKEYRHNYKSERLKVINEIQSAWTQVKSVANPLDILVNGTTTDLILAKITSQPLDVYDLFLLEAANKFGISQILTDDSDFAFVPGIQVFTANRSVIEASRRQGKLTRR